MTKWIEAFTKNVKKEKPPDKGGFLFLHWEELYREGNFLHEDPERNSA